MMRRIGLKDMDLMNVRAIEKGCIVPQNGDGAKKIMAHSSIKYINNCMNYTVDDKINNTLVNLGELKGESQESNQIKTFEKLTYIWQLWQYDKKKYEEETEEKVTLSIKYKDENKYKKKEENKDENPELIESISYIGQNILRYRYLFGLKMMRNLFFASDIIKEGPLNELYHKSNNCITMIIEQINNLQIYSTETQKKLQPYIQEFLAYREKIEKEYEELLIQEIEQVQSKLLEKAKIILHPYLPKKEKKKFQSTLMKIAKKKIRKNKSKEKKPNHQIFVKLNEIIQAEELKNIQIKTETNEERDDIQMKTETNILSEKMDEVMEVEIPESEQNSEITKAKKIYFFIKLMKIIQFWIEEQTEKTKIKNDINIQILKGLIFNQNTKNHEI